MRLLVMRTGTRETCTAEVNQVSEALQSMIAVQMVELPWIMKAIRTMEWIQRMEVSSLSCGLEVPYEPEAARRMRMSRKWEKAMIVCSEMIKREAKKAAQSTRDLRLAFAPFPAI
jgi:hypothetical protein